MAISWDQIEGGEILRNKIIGYAKPRFHKIEQYRTVAGQTNFTLSWYPTNDTVKLDINGLTYYEGVHFSVNRDTSPPSLSWTFTAANGGFNIGYDDLVFVDYWSFSDK